MSFDDSRHQVFDSHLGVDCNPRPSRILKSPVVQSRTALCTLFNQCLYELMAIRIMNDIPSTASKSSTYLANAKPVANNSQMHPLLPLLCRFPDVRHNNLLNRLVCPHSKIV